MKYHLCFQKKNYKYYSNYSHKKKIDTEKCEGHILLFSLARRTFRLLLRFFWINFDTIHTNKMKKTTQVRPIDGALAKFDMPQMASGPGSRPCPERVKVDRDFKNVLVPSDGLVLPQKPIWMEKYTTISSTSKPESLLMCIKDHFQKAEIDFEFVKDDSKIKALCGNQGGRCKFNVRLFRGDGEGEVLVEFQRRCGDILAFTSLYRNVLESLGQADLIKGPKKAPASSAAATSS